MEIPLGSLYHCRRGYFNGDGVEQKFQYVVKLQQRYFSNFWEAPATVTIPPRKHN
jgi:hypothetical protein